jgi:hypothetical protein
MNYVIEKNDLIEAFSFKEETIETPLNYFQYYDGINTNYRLVSPEELEEYILMSLKRAEFGRRSDSSENKKAFDTGWQENLDLLKEIGVSREALKPKYFRPSKYLRFKKNIIITENNNIEYDLFYLSRLLLFNKLLGSFEHIHEYGCGSCDNLYMLSDMFPAMNLVGFDWSQASVDIANILNKKGGKNIKGNVFNMQNPDFTGQAQSGTAVITIHAMEQLGNSFDSFLQYLINLKPDLIVNYEPIIELYDEENLLDYLALNYSKKRGYLNGYLNKLRELERENIIEIIEEKRPYVGGVLHEASIIIWRPVK